MAAITFGSFPRSGNFFLVDVLRKNAPTTSYNWVGHNAFLLTKEKDSFTVIRNPLECISSWIIYKNDSRPDRAEKAIRWYCAFYEKCHENNIRIFTFEDLISDPIGLLDKICNVQIRDEHQKYFRNETADKSSYKSVLGEVSSSREIQKAIDLFEKLCVHAG